MRTLVVFIRFMEMFVNKVKYFEFLQKLSLLSVAYNNVNNNFMRSLCVTALFILAISFTKTSTYRPLWDAICWISLTAQPTEAARPMLAFYIGWSVGQG